MRITARNRSPIWTAATTRIIATFAMMQRSDVKRGDIMPTSTGDIVMRDGKSKQALCLNVVVYYDNYPEVLSYLNELARVGNGNVDVVIVVNKDTDGHSAQLLKEPLVVDELNVTIRDYHENIGYLNSLLEVINDTTNLDYSFYILSNTDVEFPSDDIFGRLADADYDKNIGCIAPSIWSTRTHSYSNPHYLSRVAKRRLIFLSQVFSHPKCAQLYMRLSGIKAGRAKSLECDSQFVYSPHGCYMIFTREFIKNIKGYTYGVTLYSEESCIGELLRLHGMRCYYDSQLKVIHNESSVTGAMPSKERFATWAESIRYILDTFY